MLNKPGTVIAWSFDDERIFMGFADGTLWNGFDNVRVTPETHALVLEALGDDTDDGLKEMTADPDGLFDYGWGYCTSQVAIADLENAQVADLIDELQEVQKRNAPTSRAWEWSSDLLAPLFEEMARRQQAGQL